MLLCMARDRVVMNRTSLKRMVAHALHKRAYPCILLAQYTLAGPRLAGEENTTRPSLKRKELDYEQDPHTVTSYLVPICKTYALTTAVCTTPSRHTPGQIGKLLGVKLAHALSRRAQHCYQYFLYHLASNLCA